jgi:RHS repeat-associated protein
MKTHLCKLVLQILLVTLAVSRGLAQSGPDDPGAGLLPFSTQVGGANESVNLATGNVFISIPIRSKIGKMPFDFSLSGNFHPWIAPIYLGQQWNVSTGPLIGGPAGLLSGRLSYVEQNNTQCPGFIDEERIVSGIVDGTGALHQANATVHSAYQCGPTSATVTSADGLSAYVTATNYTLYDKSGNILTIDPSTHNQTLTDPDNVTMQKTYSTADYYTDTLGQTAISFSLGNATGSPDTYTFTGGDGNTQTYTVTYATKTLATAFNCTNPLVAEANQKTIYLPSTVTFQSTGQTYTLLYEQTPGYSSAYSTGRLTKITFPSGGSVSYAYSDANGHNGIECNSGVVPTLTRTVNDNNGNISTYTYVNSGILNGSNYAVTADFPYAHGNSGNSTIVYNFANNFQTQAKYYQAGATGTPLRTVLTCYGGNFNACATSGVNPGSVTQTDVYTYPGDTTANPSLVETKRDAYGNVTEVKKYDFGAAIPPVGNPVSDTVISYGQSWNGTSCTAYASGYINNTPCYSHTINSAGTDVAKTQITYSNTGHPTTTTRWISGSTYLTSSSAYNTNGTLHTTTDPNSNITTLNYDGSCNSLLPTSTTEPTVNGVTLTTSQTWDCNGGVVTSTSDANSPANVTHYYYNDPLWRQTQVTYPDGGSTTTTYNTGSTTPWSVSTSTAITSSLNRNTTTIYDGLGRVTQTQLTSDPDGTDYVDTTYDLVGRQATVNNPHRTATSSTDGITSYTYDALDRVTSVVEPDSSHVSTAYTNTCTTMTDEVGNARKSCVDGLGRLTSVWEDPGTSPHLNFETDYTYDALDNLLTVTQKGGSINQANWRTRTFLYDGLSRLTQATNPESAATLYAYANTGNVLCAGDPSAVCTITSPSPNQTSPSTTVTTFYAYDGLKRLTGKTYTDGDTGNPPTHFVKYGYDGMGITGCTPVPPSNPDSNPKGLRTAMCDGSGATSWKHDQMGRVLTERRTIGSVAGDFENDAYNLNGSPTTITSIGFGVTYAYGGAGRPLTATNYTGGTNKLVTAASYAPPGELTAMTNGSTSTFTGIVTNNAYNNRLQPILLSAAVSGQNPVFSECFDFHLGTRITAPAPCSFSASTLGNNGNVYQIVNNRDNTGSRNQNFMYDSLNRILQAYSSGSGSFSWGETYSPSATSPGIAPTTPGIDAWGNLTNRSGVTGKTYNEPLNCPANSNNQLTTCSLVYDAPGNMTSNGSASYVYDAESRLIASGGYSYIYDGDGQRVEKCTQGTTPGTCASGATGTLYWRGASSDPLSETDLAGTVQNNYVFFNGQRVARRDNAGLIHYYFSDHLGTHGVVENQIASACEQDIDYYPYGGVEHDYCANVAQTYKFTGKERDSESTLDYFGARHYASSLGRFVVPDPAGIFVADGSSPQSWNLYAYVLNNPLINIDPFGLFCVWDNTGNGSDGGYDSPDDPDTGSPTKCRDAGGNWFDGSPSDWGLAGDWSDQQNAGLAAQLGQQADYTFHTQATAPMPGAAPVGEIRALGTIECAATFSWSLARQANIQGDTFAGKVGQNLLGNTFSGMYDTYKAFSSAKGTAAALGSLAVNGVRQGWPGGGKLSQGLSGVAQDKALRLAFQNLGMEKLGGATVKSAASTVGNVKIGVDFLAFFYKAYQCRYGGFGA